MDIVTLGAALNGSKKYTDTVAQSLMGGVRYQGEVDYYADLPSNPEEGDAYTVKYSGTSGTDPDGTEYAWGLNHQTQQYDWIDFSKDSYTKTETNALLNGKQNVIDANNKLSADLVDDSASTNKFTNDTEKQTWNGKQDALTTSQLAAANSGIDSTKVEQIETNKTNISSEQAKTTGMSEGGSNYITVGGIRVYVSTTAPTGARTGDLWIGG